MIHRPARKRGAAADGPARNENRAEPAGAGQGPKSVAARERGYVWPPLAFACPACGTNTVHRQQGNNARKAFRARVCGFCGIRFIVGPLARIEVTAAGVPVVTPLGFFAAPAPTNLVQPESTPGRESPGSIA